jgi:glycosyltransferase involved in cell wall biosynthesis
MKAPKFSVVIPTYNREKKLRYAIESIIGQRFDDWELVVVDDGSTDRTRHVASSFGDNRVRYIYQENSGVASARNLAISNVNGEYTAFLDSDDEWFTNHLSVLDEEIQKTGVPFLFTGCVESRDAEDVVIQEKLSEEGKVQIGSSPYPSCLAIRSDLLKANPFDETLRIHSDSELISRLMLEVDAHVVPRITVRIDVTGQDRISRYDRQDFEDLVMTYSKILSSEAADLYPKALVSHKLFSIYQPLSQCYLEDGQLENAWRFHWQAVREKPTYLFSRMSAGLIKRYFLDSRYAR